MAKNYKVNWLDFTYEATFRAPFFLVAGNPLAILTALHSRLSAKWVVSPNDLLVDSGRSVADVRAKVSLFSGNGNLEIGSDAFTAKFTNPIAAGDLDVLKECIRLTHESLSSLNNGKIEFREEAVSLRIFIEILDADTDGPSFLRGLYGDSKIFAPFDTSTRGELVPGFQMEVLHDEHKAVFSFQIARAHRSRKELFVITSAKFFEGTSFASLDQKSEHMGNLLKAAFERLGLQSQSVKK